MGNESLFPDVPFSFGPKFLHDHAGHIITDPLIALVELIANAYDAGASLVDIRWPNISVRLKRPCSRSCSPHPGIRVRRLSQTYPRKPHRGEAGEGLTVLSR
jgi:hypothetical protein